MSRKNVFSWSAIVALMLVIQSCGGGDSSSSSSSSASEDQVSIAFINPSDEAKEVRVFDDEGWSVKEEVAPRTTKEVDITPGLYSLAIKKAGAEKTDMYFPLLSTDNSNLPDTVRYGIEVDEKGDTSVRYKFVPKYYKAGWKGQYFVDLTFDSSHIYAISNMSWQYSESENYDADTEIKKMEKTGYKLMMSGHYGYLPFVAPASSIDPFSPLPEEMTTSWGHKGALPKIYLMPENISSAKEIRKWLRTATL